MSLKLKIIGGAMIILAGFLVVRLGSVLNTGIKSARSTANIGLAIPDPRFAPDDPFTKDTDKDGLPDRDEVIYGTDPFNSDTDGDGYKDGEEITSSRDPLDSSSNDQTGASGISLISPTANLTDRLLNMGVAGLINNYGELDPEQMTQKVFTDILQDINQSALVSLSGSTLIDSDIKIIQDNSPAAVEKYLQTTSSVIEEGFFFPTGKIATGDVNGLLGLGDRQNYFENKYNSLKMVEVPSSWKEIHKQTLTNLAALANSTKFLTDEVIDNDPVKASFALIQLQDSFLALNNLLTQASKLAKSQNVSIKDSLLDTFQIVNNAPPVNQ